MDTFLELKKKIKGSSARVVLPEGENESVILAGSRIVEEKIARPILLGRKSVIEEAAAGLAVDLDKIAILDINASPKLDEYVSVYGKERNLPLGAARLILKKPVYFGAMMTRMGDADAMVAGIATATEEVVMASELIIGTQGDISTPSSFTLMDIPGYKGEEGSQLIFADAALNANPTSEQLADIAVSCARSARKFFGWEPRIAFLSFSTKGSATHADVDKVVEAVRIVRERQPDLLVDGELQADAAIVPEVAKKKIEEPSAVGGRANILIFPDLDAGNIGYKLVQRLTHGAAYGPFLQGFAKPVSDLSRGATVNDIVGAAILVVIEAEHHENTSH
jgi:phosphate acetyltransferase